jgi:alkaline phosphatase
MEVQVRSSLSGWRLAGGVSLGVVAIAATSAMVLSLAPVSAPADEQGSGESVGQSATSGGDWGRRARNVIFIQGDGMGIAHRELIRLASKGQNGELAMNKMDFTGFVHTDSADTKQAVTDSAAAATAYSTGVRTYNGAIAVDIKKNPVDTLLEQARDARKSTGLVTTSQVTDATPAAFGAHVPDRADQSEIARQFIEDTKVDVILGGGEDFWFPAGNPGAWEDHPMKDPTEESKGTKGNLVDRAKDLHYQYVTDATGLAQVNSGRVLGLFANEEMFEHKSETVETPPAQYEPVVPLKTMSKKALDLLSRDRDGFFLLIEEEGIDEMAHHANTPLVVKAGEALDDTVAMALQFAARTPGTLVLVVGDHETGGLAIENVEDTDENAPGEQAEDQIAVAGTDGKLQMTVDWTTNGHTGAATPITSSGPGAERLGKVLKNTDVHDAILRAMGLSHR